MLDLTKGLGSLNKLMSLDQVDIFFQAVECIDPKYVW